jgi:hypothetical protein
LRDFLEPGIRQLKAQRKRFYSAKLNSIVLPASNRDRTNVAGLIALLLFVLSIAAIPSVFALSTNQNAVAATPRDTVVQLTCRPSSVSVNAWTLCTEKVTDVGPGTPITPTGTVSFKSIKPGTFSIVHSLRRCLSGSRDSPLLGGVQTFEYGQVCDCDMVFRRRQPRGTVCLREHQSHVAAAAARRLA